ncbi:uncharacterized protein LOC132737467 [Ruditapes philippinarum]|uniref:uncharacterized protein LOC132737467 n=1 Tax=Ruditapes philippinarum TaxID=129788 RepID=UPI00295B7B72|nr:uncharacterized protein LOC132737467 [Ruditapes philippinarum]
MSDFTGVFYIFLWISYTTGTEFISQNETTWKDITTICQVALPEINYKAFMNGKEFLVDYSGKIEEQNGVWVGYYLSAAPFEYIGCSILEKGTALAQFDRNTPGLCFSACQKKGVIGINDKKCFCLNSISGLDIFATKCNTECKDQSNIECGGEEHMSLYKLSITEFEAKYEDDVGVCLSYQINSNVQSFYWNSCAITIQTICASNNGSVQELSSTTKTTSTKWNLAMNLCLQNSMTPTTITQLEQFKGRYRLTPSWTGIISSDVIYSIHDAAATHNNSRKQFGYLTQKGDTILLQFDDKVSSSRKILCKSGKTKKESNGSNVGVAVGISVVMVLVIVAVVVAVFILKRRGKLEGICFKMPTNTKPVQRTQHLSIVHKNTYETPTDSPYNEIDDATLQKNSDTKNDTFESNGHYAHTYFVLEGQESDPKVENGIANSRHEDSNSEYNTLSSNIKRGNNTNNAYDTTENAMKRLKDQHDKGIDDMKGNNSDDIEEDAYTHISDAALKNKRTDNYYGVPSSCAENEYGDVRKSNGNAQQGDGDPYNHIHV